MARSKLCPFCEVAGFDHHCRSFVDRVRQHWLPARLDARPWPARCGYPPVTDTNLDPAVHAEMRDAAREADRVHNEYVEAVTRSAEWYRRQGKSSPAALRSAIQWEEELVALRAARDRANAVAMEAAKKCDSTRIPVDRPDGWSGALDARLRGGWPPELAAVLARRLLAEAEERAGVVEAVERVNVHDHRRVAASLGAAVTGTRLTDVALAYEVATSTALRWARRLGLTSAERGARNGWRLTAAEVYCIVVHAESARRERGALLCADCGRPTQRLRRRRCDRCYQRCRRAIPSAQNGHG